MYIYIHGYKVALFLELDTSKLKTGVTRADTCVILCRAIF